MFAQTDFLKTPTTANSFTLVCRGRSARLLPFQLVWFALLLSFLSFSAACLAQVSQPAAPISTAINGKLPAASQAKAALPSKPAWTGLTAIQQQSLRPLALNWNSLSEAQKRKWLEISKNYQSLPPEDQATMHSHMNEWVALSPQQRAEARLNFATTKELSKQLTPDEKKAKWQTYQALSPEEKQKLAATAPTRPVGAATAVVPVSPKKLAAIPPHGKKPDVKVPHAKASSPTTTLPLLLPLPTQGDPAPSSALPAAQR